MADYFSEYSPFVGAKGLPSPADTPYETPGFIRSKRTPRVTTHSSRDQSSSPPPLPPDTTDKEHSRDGRYTGLDPRRFTPTLHASLVSEILNLRRELDSKNNLVENLETNLSITKTENESLHGQLSDSAREVKKAKRQVQQMEQGTYDAVEELVKERDNARAALEDLRSKFEFTQRKTRQQDEDAQRTQSIWENDKESWDNERRQLERRIHVTETRLRAVVDEMATQQSLSQIEEYTEEGTFKDSGLGNESDTASIHSATPSASPAKHRRNKSSISSRQPRHARTSVSSRTTTATPDLYARPGNTLADELDIDEEHDYDSEQGNDDIEVSERNAQAVASRHNSVLSQVDAKAQRILGLMNDSLESPFARDSHKASLESPEGVTKLYQHRATTPPPRAFHMPEPAPRATYVDSGYQPSPPVSPPRVEVTQACDESRLVESSMLNDELRPPPVNTDASLRQPARELQTKPISPPQTPVVDGVTWLQQKGQHIVALGYTTAATQTEIVEREQSKSAHTPKRDSLSPPAFVPSIAIHPPSSRPSSPQPYVLPPGTKNAFSQANITWPSQDAGAQTEEIRIDRRPVKLPAHLLPSALLPSPTFQQKRQSVESKRDSTVLIKRESLRRPPAISIPASPPLQSPVDSSPEMSRNNSSRDLRHYPLKAIPLPRPVLSPPLPPQGDAYSNNGPLNRSSQYGVSQSKPDRQHFEEIESSEHSDYDDPVDGNEPVDFIASISLPSRPPLGRFGLSDPPKAVPEDKEISPERRPGTADSYGAAPAPSVSSSRAPSLRRHTQQPPRLSKPTAGKDFRSRSPSFGSIASSSQSAHSTMPLPPYPIPLRSSSRPVTKPHSEGSQSPTPNDGPGQRSGRAGRSAHQRQVSLRKVQSAAVIRNRGGRGSPTKGHRRRRKSPELTPVQSLAFDSPAPTKFPIPELPTPLNDGLGFGYTKGSMDLKSSLGSDSARASEETHLVDSIAGTMVGEWMWKYIRKRKSFGIGDDMPELPVADSSEIVNVTAHGTRHKRWVWLSPYERTIMWDTKQPTSGPALLGKKGRKLSIQSVVDVQDNTPLTKNPELNSAWNRSILILTPERALKFTATTEERHGLWMTALRFLAQSSAQLPNQIPPLPTAKPPMPPMPPVPTAELDGVPIKRYRSPSFGRSNVRDSIRLTKGKKPDLQKASSQPDEPYGSDLADTEAGARNDSADFPAVPRLYISTARHQRQRSNTNPGVNGVRSFSSSAVTSSSTSNPQQRSTNPSSFRPSISTKSGSRRESLASPLQQNFFEAVGTVRMEAFVDPNVRDGVLYVPAPPPVIGGARRPRGSSNLSQSTVDKRRAGYVFDEDGMDPFKGF